MNYSRQVFSSEHDFYANLGDDTLSVVEEVLTLDKNSMIDRMWKNDHTAWGKSPHEISNRLGWLKSPEVMADAVDEIMRFTDEIRKGQYKQVLLLGMGGSSLAPEVFRNTFGVARGFPDLTVLDSTDPGAIRAVEKKLDFTRTLFIVSTKSGGTVETISFMKYFYHAALETLGEEKVGEHFVAITDPGSGLEKMANELGFRKIFLNDPNIGGRYSALSFFGLVPAALLGIDIAKLLDRSRDMTAKCAESVLPEIGHNTAAWLGAILGRLAIDGKDKLTLISSPSLKYFGIWIEQLIAESTGKKGKGILPVDGEIPLKPQNYSDDRLFIYMKIYGENDIDEIAKEIDKSGFPIVQLLLDDIYDLGREFFRWEVATAVAASILKINPFDQPDVESAKESARRMVAKYKKKGKLPELPVSIQTGGLTVYSEKKADSLQEFINRFFQPLHSGPKEGNKRSYIAIQAYMNPSDQTADQLQALRTAISHRFQVAVTVGFGPRFLHSTGQLHKGDSGNGLFIQLLTKTGEDCPIPDNPKSNESSIGFGILKIAQAMGDRQALLKAKRSVFTIDLGLDIETGIQTLIKTMERRS